VSDLIRMFATCSADWTGSQDSMDNVEILKRGDIQLTSAGTGIRHSEASNGNEDVHIVQIWTFPWKDSLTPKYFTR
jgi:redox-sensitive bicupin YhaK (pirin superfamily)